MTNNSYIIPHGVKRAVVKNPEPVDPKYSELFNLDGKKECLSFIQWKGSDVCISLWCPDCGSGWHYDGDFFYAWECTECGSVWEVPQYLPMKRVDDHPMKRAMVETKHEEF